MNKQLTSLQFLKDGLPGAIIAALIYFSFWLSMPFEGIFFVLAMFLSTGLNASFMQKQNIQARKDWAKPILKMLRTAWFVTFLFVFLYFISESVMGSLFKLAQQHNFHHSFLLAFFAVYDAITQDFSFTIAHSAGLYLYYLYLIIGSIVGLLIGFIITHLAAIIFYQQKLWTLMFIPIIVNLFVIGSVSLTILWGSYS